MKQKTYINMLNKLTLEQKKDLFYKLRYELFDKEKNTENVRKRKKKLSTKKVA